MFEKIGQSAENVIGKVSVSRRGFLGRTAKVAAGLGAVAAGLFASPAEARATKTTCFYVCPSGATVEKEIKGGIGDCPHFIRYKGEWCSGFGLSSG